MQRMRAAPSDSPPSNAIAPRLAPPAPRRPLQYTNFRKEIQIGEGVYGKIYCACATGKGLPPIKIALKVYSLQAGMSQDMLREISIIRSLSHPNIVRYHAVSFSHEPYTDPRASAPIPHAALAFPPPQPHPHLHREMSGAAPAGAADDDDDAAATAAAAAAAATNTITSDDVTAAAPSGDVPSSSEDAHAAADGPSSGEGIADPAPTPAAATAAATAAAAAAAASAAATTATAAAANAAAADAPAAAADEAVIKTGAKADPLTIWMALDLYHTSLNELMLSQRGGQVRGFSSRQIKVRTHTRNSLTQTHVPKLPAMHLIALFIFSSREPVADFSAVARPGAPACPRHHPPRFKAPQHPGPT
jgi:hypothetical protein